MGIPVCSFAQYRTQHLLQLQLTLLYMIVMSRRTSRKSRSSLRHSAIDVLTHLDTFRTGVDAAARTRIRDIEM